MLFTRECWRNASPSSHADHSHVHWCVVELNQSPCHKVLYFKMSHSTWASPSFLRGGPRPCTPAVSKEHHTLPALFSPSAALQESRVRDEAFLHSLIVYIVRIVFIVSILCLHLCWMYEFKDRKFASNSNRLYTQLHCCRVLVPWHWLPLVCISHLYRIGGHTVYGHSGERLWLLLRRWFGLPVLWGDWWRASSSGLLFFVCRPRVTCVAV